MGVHRAITGGSESGPKPRVRHSTTGVISETRAIHCLDSVGTFTLASAALGDGEWLYLTDHTGSVSSTSPTTIDTEGTETINGSSSVSITTGYDGFHLHSDGNNWFVTTTPPGSV